jgi:hypothetical protein
LASLAIIFSTRFLQLLSFRISFFTFSTILPTALHFSRLNAFPISFKESHLKYQESTADLPPFYVGSPVSIEESDTCEKGVTPIFALLKSGV